MTCVPTPTKTLRFPLTRALLIYWDTESRDMFEHVRALDMKRAGLGIPSIYRS